MARAVSSVRLAKERSGWKRPKKRKLSGKAKAGISAICRSCNRPTQVKHREWHAAAVPRCTACGSQLDRVHQRLVRGFHKTT